METWTGQHAFRIFITGEGGGGRGEANGIIMRVSDTRRR